MAMVPFVFAGILLLTVLAVIMSVAKIYNRLVALNNQCDNGFAQIEVQLKRRYDLIPNLVECTKSYLTHERETLEAVIAARNQATKGLAAASQNPKDAGLMKAWMGAEGALTGALGKLSFVMEDYPDLKANETVASLTEELSSTENRISFARQAFNDWCTRFNMARQEFPNVLFAGWLGFGADRELLEITNSDAIQEAPEVALN